MSWCICSAGVQMLTSPNFTFVWRGNYCLCQAARERERRRECSRLSTAVLGEPSPHTCYLIGPGGRRSERDPDKPDMLKTKVGYIPLLHPWPNHVWITHHSMTFKYFWLSVKKRRHCIHQNLFQRLLMVLNMHLLFIFYFWTYFLFYLFIYLICLFASFIVTVEREQKIMQAKTEEEIMRAGLKVMKPTQAPWLNIPFTTYSSGNMAVLNMHVLLNYSSEQWRSVREFSEETNM